MKELPNWLDGAHYTYHPNWILPTLDIYVPKSSTANEFRYRGRKQCDLIICLLDFMKIPGEVTTQ